MPKVFTSKSQKIGELGEGIAKIYLEKSVSSSESGVKPVENMTTWKIKKQRAVIAEYLRSQRNVSDWQADVLFVYLDIKDKTAKVEFLEYAF